MTFCKNYLETVCYTSLSTELAHKPKMADPNSRHKEIMTTVRHGTSSPHDTHLKEDIFWGLNGGVALTLTVDG